MEWTGSWWRPEKREEIGGQLAIDDHESMLTAFGSLADWSGHNFRTGVGFPTKVPDIPLLHGFAGGTTLSVLGLTCVFPRPPGSLGSENWLCEAAVERHLAPDHPLVFPGIDAEFEHLSSWVSARNVESKLTFDPPTIEARIRGGSLVEADLGSGRKVAIHQSVGSSADRDGLQVDYPVIAYFEVEEPGEWQELSRDCLTPMESLLWLATSRLGEIERMWIPSETERDTHARLWASTIRPRRRSIGSDKKRRLVSSEMLFRADEMPGGIGGGLADWYQRIWPRVSHVLGRLLAYERAPFMYADDRFVTAVTALEEYHRGSFGDRDIPTGEHRKRVRKVTEVVASTEPELTDWATKALQGANRISLKQRISSMLSLSEDLTATLLSDYRETFVDVVCEARNEYAHGRQPSSLPGGEKLHWAAEGLRWIIRDAVLRDFGFADSAARIMKNWRFSQEAQRLQEALRFV